MQPSMDGVLAHLQDYFAKGLACVSALPLSRKTAELGLTRSRRHHPARTRPPVLGRSGPRRIFFRLELLLARLALAKERGAARRLPYEHEIFKHAVIARQQR